MTSVAFEAFLARLYVDAESRARFLTDPAGSARSAGLSDAEVDALLRIDRTGLALAADSFRSKSESKRRRGRGGWLRRLLSRPWPAPRRR